MVSDPKLGLCKIVRKHSPPEISHGIAFMDPLERRLGFIDGRFKSRAERQQSIFLLHVVQFQC